MTSANNDFFNRFFTIIALITSLGALISTVFLGKIDNETNNLWIYVIAAVIVVLIWIGWFIRRRYKHKQLSKHNLQQNDKSAFNGALSYSRDDKDRFFGRHTDIISLLTQIKQDEYHLGILYGESGTGKTSLIQAGIMPQCEVNYYCIYISFSSLPKLDIKDREQESGIISFLLSKVNKEPVFPNAVSSFDELAKTMHGLKIKTIIFFLDQFEQIFDRVPEQIRNRYADVLRQTSTKYEGRFKFVISVRADYFGHVDNLFRFELKYKYFLKQFNATQAREVIRGSCGLPGNLPEKEPNNLLLEFEDEIIRDLQNTDGYIHPVEISLICWIMLRVIGKLDKTNYISGQRKQGWLDRYMDDVLKSLPNKQQALLALSSLIRNDKADTLSADEISTRSGLNLKDTEKLLDHFERNRLIVKENPET